MGVIKRNGNTYGGGGGASADGKAESSAIAPVFDDTETYAEGDRVMYEDELYVFNTAHTGAWDAADADKSDVDSEMPDKLTSQQMQDIKDAFSGMNKGAPLRMMHYSTEEQVVGTWIDGKPLYQKTVQFNTPSTGNEGPVYTGDITIDIKNFTGYIIYASSNFTQHLPLNMILSSNDYWWTIVGQSVNILRQKMISSTYRNCPCIVTVQYTKTTD